MTKCTRCGIEHTNKHLILYAWTCSRCVQELVDGHIENDEEKPKKKSKTYVSKSGFPRGWHFKKEFIAPDGRKYSRGKLIEG